MVNNQVKFVLKAVVFHPWEEPKFLILKHRHFQAATNSVWDLPGGKAEFGENPEEALRREIVEETGLSVGRLYIIKLETALVPDKGTYYIFAGYYCQARDGRPRLSAEHATYRWVTPQEFQKLRFSPFMERLVEEVFHHENRYPFGHS